MQVIHIHHPYQKDQIPVEDVVMVLGFFDGVHQGHREVINRGKKIAQKKGLKLAVMTFNQHPSIVFQKIEPDNMKYLTSFEQKESIMADLGVDFLYLVEFTSSFASLPPQDFVDQYIVDLHTKAAVAGFDYTYGPRDIATMENLPKYAKGRFEIITVSKKSVDGEKISSTRIRKEMEKGNMDAVTKLFGNEYEIQGTVIHGDARGRTLGFPTANIKVDHHVRLPKLGIYAVEIEVSGIWYQGMASIGHNVTFGEGRQMTVEVYILNFHQDIYGERVSVKWHKFLREEIKFSGRDELIEQLKQDEIHTAQFFSEKGK